MAQQDDYYYEIQLTNKQLVFYFLAGATGLILSFLAGVMVGRGVDNASGGAEAQAPRPVQEERVIAEEPAKPSPPPPEELTYAQRLESEKSDEALEKPARTDAKAGQPPKPPSGKAGAQGVEKAVVKSPEPAASAPAAKAGTEKAPRKPAASPAPKAASPPGAKAQAPKPGTFTIQVGAFKDKETAESVVARLKKKGFAAFVIAPEGADALFNVRVGSFAARAEAERVQAKLREEERFKPFIVKN